MVDYINILLPKIFQPYSCVDLVRLGKIFDGGYLVNKKDVIKSNILVSFGIGQDFSFEQNFCSLANCPVHAYDNSEFVYNNKEYKNFFINENIHFPINVDNHNSVDTIDVETIFSQFESNVFLKCDIEGLEYKILDNIIKYSNIFSGIVIEFHEINKEQNYNDLINFISKINQKLVHIHVNNYMYYKIGEEENQRCIPDVLELIFSSSKNLVYDRHVKLPHLFDMPNNPFDKDFIINF